MKKLIIIPIILILVSACQKETEISLPEETEYMVYNQSLECRPLETDNGFFLISLKDSVPWLVHINQSGISEKLTNLSTYLPSNVSYDSIRNLNISHLKNENIMINFSYNHTENETSQAFIQAIEIQQGGEIIDEINQAIPTYNNNNYRYIALSKNNLSEWVLVSSYSEQNTDPNIASELNIQTTIFKTVGDNIETVNNIESFSGMSIDQAYTVVNNNIVIVLTENQIGPLDQISAGNTYNLLIIYPDGSSSQITLDGTLESIDIVKQVDDELLIVGALSLSINQSVLKVFALDNSSNISWQKTITISESFNPTCILTKDDGFLLGGINGDTRNFSWNNVYNQINNTIAIYNFDSEGEIIWNKNQETEFSTLIVGVCLSEYNYSWLLTKRTYGTYNNIALLKTDFEGNFK